MMRREKHVHTQTGQTLLELVIAIGVAGLIITGLVVAALSSLRYSQESRMRSSAVKYAQESLELARATRDTSGWDTFFAYTGSETKTWCLDAAKTWTEDDGTGCGAIEAGSQFRRSVTFTWNDPVVEVVSTVTWHSGSTDLSTSLTTYLTEWR